MLQHASRTALQEALRGRELFPHGAGDAEVKAELRGTTEEAVSRGAFGAPWRRFAPPLGAGGNRKVHFEHFRAFATK